MSRTLKWVLGILAVLVVVAVLASAFWVWQNRAQMVATYRPNAVQPNPPAAPGAPNGQPFPNGPRAFGDGRRFPFGGFGFRGPMMGDRRFMNFGPFGMGFFLLGGLLRLILPLGLLILVAILSYQLGKRAGLSSAPAPVTRQEPSPTDTSKSGQDPSKTGQQ